MTLYIGAKTALSMHDGWRRIVTGADKVTDYAVQGNDLYLVSFANAPNGKLLRLDAAHPDLANAEVIVPPSDAVLTSGTELGTGVLYPAADALYLRVVKNGYGAAVRVPYGAHPTVSTVDLPAGQQVNKISSDESVPGVVLRLDSWVDPGDFYRYDPAKASLTATGLVVKNDVDQTNRVAEEVQVKAKDGTLIPLSIIYLKGTKSRRQRTNADDGLWRLRRRLDAELRTTGFGMAGTRWRRCICPCTRRRRARRGLASSRLQADKAQHLGRLYRLWPLSDRSPLRQQRQLRYLEPERRRDFDRANHYR